MFRAFVSFLTSTFFSLSFSRPEDLHRIRVEHMERQLANLTGLVQKALIQTVPPTGNINQNYLGVPGQYRGKNRNFNLSIRTDFLCCTFVWNKFWKMGKNNTMAFEYSNVRS